MELAASHEQATYNVNSVRSSDTAHRPPDRKTALGKVGSELRMLLLPKRTGSSKKVFTAKWGKLHKAERNHLHPSVTAMCHLMKDEHMYRTCSVRMYNEK
jgi:hypothetical protein